MAKERSQRLRERIKALFRRDTIGTSLADRLRKLNPLLRGWCNFYRHAWGAKRVFSSLDSYVWWTIVRWLRKKHRRPTWAFLKARYGRRRPGGRSFAWTEDGVTAFVASKVTVEPFRLARLRPPHFARLSGEPGA